jgi:hypothetical protein
MALSGTNLYIAGDFTVYRGTTQIKKLAAIARSNAAVVDWNPQPDWGVAALRLDGTTLYVGGTFTRIGGGERSRVAAFDITNHALKDFRVGIADYNNVGVAAIEVGFGRVYLGGTLGDVIETQPNGARPAKHAAGRLAAFDAQTGRYVTTFKPVVDNVVGEIKLSGSTLYIAGSFGSVGGGGGGSAAPVSSDGSGASFAHKGVAAVNALTGEVSSWWPEPYSRSPGVTLVTTIAPDGDRRCWAVTRARRSPSPSPT